jgi:hypothetical protein
MKKLILAVAALFFCGAAFANPISADSELADATGFLDGQNKLYQDTDGKAGISVKESGYYRFFTTFAVPVKYTLRGEEVPLRKQCEQALPYVLNSCMRFDSVSDITKPKRVPGSDTLWFIDVRDFGWPTDDIDDVFKLQSYFLVPLVDSQNNVIIFRADWFVVYASDNSKTDDRGIKDIPYYTLLYGKGREPKNADEFRKFWQVDEKTIRATQSETGTVIDAGDSGVSQHTRQLRTANTVFGRYWETRDVKTHDIDLERILSRDYIEDVFAKQADAGEYIATTRNKLKAYLLSAGNNDKFKRVENGDVGIVVDRQDPHDPRVRTWASCARCHGSGIIPYTNAIADLYRLGGDLRAKDKELAQLLKYFYLSEDGSEVEDDNRVYERAVKKCNGLSPAENMKAFVNVSEWYNEKVSTAQASVECGYGEDVEAFKKSIRKTTSGRVTFLYHDKSMPREVWDTPNAGGYSQCVLLNKGLQQAKKEEPKKEEQPKPAVYAECVVENAPIVDKQGRPVVYLSRGSRVRVMEDYADEWYIVRADRWEGYIQKKYVQPTR